jgi:hypothetical protein
MKKFLSPFFPFFPLAVGLLAFTLLLAGCQDATDNDDSPVDPDVPLASLVNTVWAGETPRSGDWLTMSFRDADKIVMSFIIDNSSSEWSFTYDAPKKTGTIVTGSPWSPAPEGFTVSTDAKILTVKNYGGHGGDKQFKRLRQADLTLDANPFSPGALDTNLVGSIWGGSTSASSNTGFITIGFRTKAESDTSQTGTNVAVIQYAQDHTTAVWDYSYDSSTRKGTGFTNGHTPDNTSTTWNPGEYTISADGKTITFSSFMGSEKSFSRFR